LLRIRQVVRQVGSQAGNGFEKAAALRALSDWSDKDAINTLRTIARTAKEGTEKQKALDGMSGLIQRADSPPEQRLLLLRDAFQVAGNVGQKKAVLTAMKGAACFNTMAFAGQYLNNQDLQQATAHTIMEVAMADKYKGTLVSILAHYHLFKKNSWGHVLAIKCYPFARRCVHLHVLQRRQRCRMHLEEDLQRYLFVHWFRPGVARS